jgi:hypothetical protein
MIQGRKGLGGRLETRSSLERGEVEGVGRRRKEDGREKTTVVCEGGVWSPVDMKGKTDNSDCRWIVRGCT